MASSTIQTIVITGAGSGIGRALALEFHRRGLSVYATDLNEESLNDLTQQGISGVKLDVNNASDIAALIGRLEDDGVTPDMLVNNAGFGAMGPLAEMPMERLRLQFETNVFSVLALCQAFIPGMMRKGGGRIANIGSVSGVMTTPFAGAYCASKSAVIALSAALRMELAPFGIDVLTIQPGGIRSDFGVAAARGVAEQLARGSVYAAASEAIVARAQAGQENATTAEEFARQMVEAVLKENPAPVIPIGVKSLSVPLMQRYVPTRVRERILSRKFQLDQIKPPEAAQ